MRKTIAAIALSLAAACTGGTVVTTTGDPCLEYSYRNPACDTNYSWTDGYYDTSHIWIRPRYVRRTTVVVTPSYRPPVYAPPVIVRPAPVVVNRSVTVVRPVPVVRSRTYVTTPSSGSTGLRMNGRRIR